MRFVANGPNIPDELLLARDQGRVVFFCGAGVSLARAGLPSFFQLAQKVVSTLRVAGDSQALKLMHVAHELEERGIPGVVSADRIFGLLEREFDTQDIQAAVADALQPKEGCDRSAHQILLQLATTETGQVRLVTTNFDRLFSDCAPELTSWFPPRLPDPARPAELNGVVYLHGRASMDYRRAENDGFILSSSEFGRAYLADGWATEFIREVIRRYIVVFVGYSADDPPVQYLLEALNRANGRMDNVFAFQSGEESEAAARWRHKGVQAVAYDAHHALWETLSLWAERARDPKGWRQNLVCTARLGPEQLAPYLRGQVAHLVSTLDGARDFCEGTPPPSDWLCVFDPSRRYAAPGRADRYSDQGPVVDPFDLYGIDSDLPPKRQPPEESFAQREVPKDAWDCFRPNRLDWTGLNEANLASFRGRNAQYPSQLPPRIRQLGYWFARVSDQPAAVWWAAHQTRLHPDIKSSIQWELERSKTNFPKSVRAAWNSVLESVKTSSLEEYRDWFSLKADIARDGWSQRVVREYASARRARLSTEPNVWGAPKPPSGEHEPDLSELIRRDVEYPEHQEKIDVPDQWLSTLLRALRFNLELARDFETEIGGYGLYGISPIVPDTSPGTGGDRTRGLSAAIMEYVGLFARLTRFDDIAAKSELNAWPQNDGSIFSRLRVWAAGLPKFLSPDEASNIFVQLDDAIFWSADDQRDLLIALAARWNDLGKDVRKAIEDRLFAGRSQRASEAADEYQERAAHLALSRISWLRQNGCQFDADIDGRISALRLKAPQWKAEYASAAVESMESRSGWVGRDTSYEALLNIPISLVLTRAKELNVRTREFVENDPFSGLAAERPVRALLSLVRATTEEDLPRWAWERFLSSETRKKDRPRLVRFVAAVLLRLPPTVFTKMVDITSGWLRDVAEVLSGASTKLFDSLVDRLIAALGDDPALGSSSVIRGDRPPDWPTESINAPSGRLAEALMDDPRAKVQAGVAFPDVWRRHVEGLLAIPGNARLHAITMFAFNLGWFYTIDAKWTESLLLPSLESPIAEERDAGWAGFLWGVRHLPPPGLYERLKGGLLELPTNPIPSRRSYVDAIAGLILGGWLQRHLSNDEVRDLLLRADDQFRVQFLWNLKDWSIAREDGGPDTASRTQTLIEFLQSVWPRQLAAKSAAVSAGLCDLALANEEGFILLQPYILPLVTKFDGEHLVLPQLRKSKDTLVDRFPSEVLGLLDAVLPEDVRSWPYGADEVLARIGAASRELQKDERLQNLMRRWNAR